MHPDLSFDQAPPISVPFRFFLTAPWFGVAAGLLLAWVGEPAVLSRWTPAALALTHLLAVGFMLQAMAGALLQFVPVAAGGNVWRPRLVAGIVHPALAVAAVVLAAAFLSMSGALFRLAAVLFVATVGFHVAVVGTALWRTPAKGNTVATLRVAVAGLAVTVALGATLAEGLGSGARWPLVEFANVHAAWGLGAWALLLLAGVAYFVVPMFQLTPPYPLRFGRGLPPALLVVLLVWSAQLWAGAASWQPWVLVAGLSLAAAFAATTLRLQMQRRRKVCDATFWFFRGAMVCLLAILASVVAMTVIPALDDPRGAYWLGVLALPGVFVSAINGMLYKIVPFLSWLHLQRLAGATMLPPNMRDMLSEAATMGQLRLHFAAVACLLAATFWPAGARLGGVLFALSCAWLARNLLRAVRVYRQFKGRIPAAAAGRGP